MDSKAQISCKRITSIFPASFVEQLTNIINNKRNEI